MTPAGKSFRDRLTYTLNEHRALLMLTALFVLLALTAPKFLTTYNMLTILKGASLNGIVAIGFTLIFILGQLDLSIGAALLLCGMLTVGLQPQCGWAARLLRGCAAQ